MKMECCCVTDRAKWPYFRKIGTRGIRILYAVLSALKFLGGGLEDSLHFDLDTEGAADLLGLTKNIDT